MHPSTAIYLLFFLLPFQCGAQAFQIDSHPEGVAVLERGDSVLFFQSALKGHPETGSHPRAQYIHPLYDLDGKVLTEDFPADHLHQRGIFWAWHEILIKGSKIADGWDCTDISWHVAETLIHDEQSGELAEFTIKTYWKSPNWTDKQGAQLPFVEEKATIRVYPRTATYRVIDIDISLLALAEGLQIAGSQDEKGYGGFGPRIKLPEQLVFTSSTGKVEPQNLQVQAGPWMDISGPMGKVGKETGLTIMCHPRNPKPYTNWILRRAKSMQNAVYPGKEAVSVSTSTPLKLTYRLLLHEGSADNIPIADIYRAFADVPTQP